MEWRLAGLRTMRRRQTSGVPPDAFSSALDQALRSRSTTLVSLREQLIARGVGVSLSTLSYWRSGQRQPEGRSLELLSEIEDILNLGPGELLDVVGPSRRRGPARATARFDEMLVDGVRINETLAYLGFHEHHKIIFERSVHVVCEVDRDRRLRRQTVRAIYQSAADDVSRIPVVLTADGERGLGEVTVERVLGGHLGRTIVLPHQGIYVAEMVFERPLRSGETTVIEHTLRLDPGFPDDSYEQYVFGPTQEGLLWVRFDPSEVPAFCDRYTSTVADGELSTNLDPQGAPSVHTAVRNFGPGSFGLRWHWD